MFCSVGHPTSHVEQRAAFVIPGARPWGTVHHAVPQNRSVGALAAQVRTSPEQRSVPFLPGGRAAFSPSAARLTIAQLTGYRGRRVVNTSYIRRDTVSSAKPVALNIVPTTKGGNDAQVRAIDIRANHAAGRCRFGADPGGRRSEVRTPLATSWKGESSAQHSGDSPDRAATRKER